MATDRALDEAALDRLLDLTWTEGARVQACAALATADGLTPRSRLDYRDWVRSQAAAALELQARLRAVLGALAYAMPAPVRAPTRANTAATPACRRYRCSKRATARYLNACRYRAM